MLTHFFGLRGVLCLRAVTGIPNNYLMDPEIFQKLPR